MYAYGTKTRDISKQIKRHKNISPHVLNLSEEGLKWLKLSKALRRRVIRLGI